MQPPKIQYARSGDIDIAYQVIGNGSMDLVHVSGFVSHGDLLWDLPMYTTLFNAFSEFSRVIALDKRGTGLSDRSLGFGSAADRMDDIRAVMDAAGVDQAAIHGVSEGGPLALLFAATYPDRVSKLVVYGTFARMLWAPDYPIGQPMEFFDKSLELLTRFWGTGHVMRYFIQNAPDEAIPLLARYERSSCTPLMVEEIMRANIEIDIRSVLSAISVPTLVVHTTGDPVIPIENGRYLAENIPGAQFLELDGAHHGDWNGYNIASEIREFLLGEAAAPKSDRLLATVLFTDIVSSTQRDVELGDRRWRTLLDDHDRAVRAQVERFLGRIVKTTGDGVLATFDGPARGIECARQLAKAVKPLGLDVRAGLHTGEIERRGDDIAGLGVVIARRVCDLAGSGEVLASRTVRDLVIGSDITFEDRGVHALKGVPDDWQLYAVAS